MDYFQVEPILPFAGRLEAPITAEIILIFWRKEFFCFLFFYLCSFLSESWWTQPSTGCVGRGKSSYLVLGKEGGGERYAIDRAHCNTLFAAVLSSVVPSILSPGDEPQPKMNQINGNFLSINASSNRLQVTLRLKSTGGRWRARERTVTDLSDSREDELWRETCELRSKELRCQKGTSRGCRGQKDTLYLAARQSDSCARNPGTGKLPLAGIFLSPH